MNQYKRIFIVGHPGAGKGLLAKTLAEKLRWKYINADLGLESKFGKTLIEILGKHGVDHFNQCLEDSLKAQLNQEKIVVATDGNIADLKNNRQLLSLEFVVYLKTSTIVQLNRGGRNQENRS